MTCFELSCNLSQADDLGQQSPEGRFPYNSGSFSLSYILMHVGYFPPLSSRQLLISCNRYLSEYSPSGSDLPFFIAFIP